ncbi:hypothetical protein KC336_g81 [Hortaea werneckii]|nr:hypothetical protein KC336_g81 [Hortaea werneckii]
MLPREVLHQGIRSLAKDGQTQQHPDAATDIHEPDGALGEAVVVLEHEGEGGEEEVKNRVDEGHVQTHERADGGEEEEFRRPNDGADEEFMRGELLIDFLVFRSSNVGGYVSSNAKNPAIVMTPMAIAMTQNIQRQPSACARNPPATGPMTGPRSGPIAQMAIAPPRCSGFIRSAIVPPPLSACDGEEDEPQITDVIDDRSAVQLAQRRHDKGPEGEAEQWKVRITSGTPGANMEEAKGVRRVRAERTAIRRCWGRGLLVPAQRQWVPFRDRRHRDLVRMQVVPLQVDRLPRRRECSVEPCYEIKSVRHSVSLPIESSAGNNDAKANNGQTHQIPKLAERNVGKTTSTSCIPK